MRCIEPHEFIAAEPPLAIDGDEIQLWLFPAAVPTKARDHEPRWRALLAGHVGAGHLRLARGPHGKPFLPAPAALEFNISHTRGALLAAVSRRQALGVDIESGGRARPALELAARYFTPAESNALARLDAAQQQAAFLRLWTCKEAVLKALGAGISYGLDRLEFTLDGHGLPERLNVIDASANAAAEWQIVRLEPAPPWCGALAWRGEPRTVRAFVATGAPGKG